MAMAGLLPKRVEPQGRLAAARCHPYRKRSTFVASLYKRATPSQARILRAVEGAVKDAANAHQWQLHPRAARSIAKRAAGTLTAQWPDVLAAKSMPSDWRVNPPGPVTRRDRSESAVGDPERRASQVTKRSPLIRIWKQLAYLIGEAKRGGQPERAAALVEAIKIVAAQQAKA